MISFKLHTKHIPVFFIVVDTEKASAVDVCKKPLIFVLKYKVWLSDCKEGCRNEQQG